MTEPKSCRCRICLCPNGVRRGRICLRCTAGTHDGDPHHPFRVLAWKRHGTGAP